MRKMRNACHISVGNPEEKRLLAKPRRRWDLKEILCQGVDWFHQAQEMVQWWVLLNTAMNLRVP
jgi:hypothetical protein